jgi:hypothetical protein
MYWRTIETSCLLKVELSSGLPNKMTWVLWMRCCSTENSIHKIPTCRVIIVIQNYGDHVWDIKRKSGLHLHVDVGYRENRKVFRQCDLWINQTLTLSVLKVIYPPVLRLIVLWKIDANEIHAVKYLFCMLQWYLWSYMMPRMLLFWGKIFLVKFSDLAGHVISWRPSWIIFLNIFLGKNLYISKRKRVMLLFSPDIITTYFRE